MYIGCTDERVHGEVKRNEDDFDALTNRLLVDIVNRDLVEDVRKFDTLSI